MGSAHAGRVFTFGDFRADVDDRSLTCRDVPVEIPSRVFQTLVILLEAYPRMVTKATLQETLWPDTVVDESSLAQNVYRLRKALGKSPGGGEYIETVPRHGYRFVGDVTCPQPSVPQAPEIPQESAGDVVSAVSNRRVVPRRTALVGVILATVAAAALLIAPARPVRPANPDAARLVELGRAMWKRRPNNNASIRHLFQRAIQLDPNYAPAYVALAEVEATAPPPAAEAQQLVLQALRMDSRSAEAHATAGFIAMVDRWDWAAAEREFQVAIGLDPRCAIARQWYSLFLSLRGRHAEASRQIESALAVEPGSPNLLTAQCWQRAFEGRFDSAAESCRLALSILPTFSMAGIRLFQIAALEGNAEAAAFEFTRASADGPISESLASRLESGARQGTTELLRRLLPPMQAAHIRLAELYALLDDREQALAEMRQVVAGHEFFAVFIRAEPAFWRLAGDARYEELLAQVGLPPSARPAPH